ncbi:hypothetical protein NE637_05890 [Desulfovibrio desulfuricans]|uniref:hypothetical protein n=1 Tax=Desulfovibrio desulfuricans TaxID=876 RepID=UPI001D063505|nr:hypothetical protein [Desulfovibrio desulfuricans]MCB6542977.1 hypothetical protein [Desulfovibrio desulfuricans]MCB6565946.1 hypothetical protein [Desulfovibrio desulfuricans]MCB7347077.1 hypothetical protein [Desulfovibrio desulfuricans]MCQ4860682.1 hypothetical protein [Desulfovibrio desulfuricans]MCQ5219154.1 hypothetical protein [Desulfovibrio desulfuricans]
MVQKVLVVIRRKYVAAKGEGLVNRAIPGPPHHGRTAKAKSHSVLKINTYFKNLAGSVCLQLPPATVTAENSESMEQEKERSVRRKNILPSINAK